MIDIPHHNDWALYVVVLLSFIDEIIDDIDKW